MRIRRDRFYSWTLFLSLAGALCLQAISNGRAQDKTGDAPVASPQAENLLDLRGDLTDRVILLADIKDGQPLPPGEGPFRVIVPGEKRPARWVRQVRSLTVRKN